MKICSNAQHFLFLFWYWNLVLIQIYFYFSAAVTKRYKCTQEDVQKIVGTSLVNAPSCVRSPQKNPQATDEEIRQRKTQLDSLENKNEKLENISRTG